MTNLPLSAQLILTLDPSGKLSAEMPTQNGGRRKIVLSDYDQDILSTSALYQALFLEIRRLDDQRLAQAARAKEIADQRSRQVFSYVNDTHGEALARKVVPGLEPTKSGALRKLGQNTLPREAGAEKTQTKPGKPKPDLDSIQAVEF